MADLIEKRSPQERLIIAKTLIESVLDDLPSAQPTQTNTPNALESLDCISRQAAIDALHMHLMYRMGTDSNKKRLDDWINSLPSAQPEQRWIPCSERLPEDGRQVLVYARSVHYALAKYDEMREADGTYKKQWVTFDAWKPFYTIKEVIAWMPLPEPYKGGSE